MIRTYIKNNFKNSNINEIKTSIESSIKEKKEETLPGLGVFFEIAWTNSTDTFKNELLSLIKKNI